MADEVIKQKLLLEPEVSQTAASKLEEVVAKAASKGLKKGLMNFDSVIKSYSNALTKAGEAQVNAYAAAAVDSDVASLIGGDFVAEGDDGSRELLGQIISPEKVAEAAGYASFPEFMRSMYSAGYAPNQIHSQVRSIARDIAGKIQPNLKELNIPLERAAKQLRAFNTQQKAASTASTISQRAGALADVLTDPNNGLSDEERFALTRAFANQLSSLTNRSFVEKGVLTSEESAQFAAQVAEIRSELAGIKNPALPEAPWMPRGGLVPRSATQSMMVAERATEGTTNPLYIQRAISRIGGGLSATERYAWAYKINDENSKFYWDSRFKSTMQDLTTPSMDSDTRHRFADWYSEQDALGRAKSATQDALGKSTEQYWQVKRKNAVDNIVNRSVMDPEAKKYFQEWIKAQNKNTFSLNSLTTWIKSTSGMAVSGYMAGKFVGGIATDVMEGRTSWLADTQNPYSTRRDVLQQWGKKYAPVAGAGVGALVGSLFGPIGTLVGSAIGTAGTMIWAQHNIDQKKIADEYAKYSGNINIQRALYGNNIGYNAANAIQNSNLANAADVLSLNTTSAMLPGAMAFGAVSEQQMVGMSYLPDYWRALMNRENPLDILLAYRENAKNINPALVPYITQMAGLSESLRGLAMADNFEQLYAHKDEWAGMDLQQFAAAMQNTQDAIGRAAISQRQLNTQFLEQSQSTRGNGLGGRPVADLLDDLPGSSAAKAIVAEALSENIRFGDLNVYIDGVQAAKRELKVQDWNEQTIYTSGGA